MVFFLKHRTWIPKEVDVYSFSSFSFSSLKSSSSPSISRLPLVIKSYASLISLVWVSSLDVVHCLIFVLILWVMPAFYSGMTRYIIDSRSFLFTIVYGVWEILYLMINNRHVYVTIVFSQTLSLYFKWYIVICIIKVFFGMPFRWEIYVQHISCLSFCTTCS